MDKAEQSYQAQGPPALQMQGWYASSSCPLLTQVRSLGYVAAQAQCCLCMRPVDALSVEAGTAMLALHPVHST